MASCTAILLAAGMSRRMGAANKLLLPLDGVPIIRHAALALVDAGLNEIVVVTGADAGEVTAALKGLPLSFIHNPAYEAGMGSTIAAAANAFEAGRSLLICLGDMPCVAPATIAALLVDGDPGEAIRIPVSQGRRGHPVHFGALYLTAVQKLTGDTGAREIVRANASLVREVAVEDPGILVDVDTPAMLEAVRDRFTSSQRTNRQEAMR